MFLLGLISIDISQLILGVLKKDNFRMLFKATPVILFLTATACTFEGEIVRRIADGFVPVVGGLKRRESVAMSKFAHLYP